MDEVKRKVWLYRLVITLLILLVLYAFLMIKPFWHPFYRIILVVLGPFLFSYFIAYLLHPVVERLHRWGVYRPIALLILYLFFFGGIGFGIYKGLPIFIDQLRELSDSIPGLVESYESWIKKIERETNSMPSFITEGIDDVFIGVEGWLQNIIERIIGTVKKVLDSILLFIVIPFLVFYISKDFNEINQFIFGITPKKYRKTLKEYIIAIDDSFGRYIRGQLFVMAVLMVVATAIFFFLGLNYSLVLGIIVGATDIIPYFGPVIGAIPVVIIAATMSKGMIIKSIVAILILQFIEGNILSPNIIGKSLHIHPIVIILAILAGGEVGGIVGLLLAVPTIAILRVIFIHLKKHYRKS